MRADRSGIQFAFVTFVAAVVVAGCSGGGGGGGGGGGVGPAEYAYPEGAGVAVIPVSRTNGRSGAVSVAYATEHGSADLGDDYSVATGVLSGAAGDDAVKTFNITLVDDPTAEGDETVKLHLTDPTGGASLGDPHEGILTILDPVGTGIEFVLEEYEVYEGEVAVISVKRSGIEAATVQYGTENGTAVAPGDYPTTTGMLTWAANDTSEKTFTIAIPTDATAGKSETVILGLVSPTGEELGENSIATLRILDPPPDTVELVTDDFPVLESAGVAVVVVSRTGIGDGAVSVGYSTTAGTASDPTDFTTAAGTLNWSDGDTAPKFFNVTLVSDATAEGTEFFNVTLSSPTGATLGDPATGHVTISDRSEIEFAVADFEVDESEGTAVITVFRRGDPAAAATVDYSIVSGTAVMPGDYSGTPGTLTWAGGDGSPKTFNISIVADATGNEGDETVLLTLEDPTGAVLGPIDEAELHIIDRPGTIQFVTEEL